MLKKHSKNTVGSNYSIRHFPNDISLLLTKKKEVLKKVNCSKNTAKKKLGAIIASDISKRTLHLLNPTHVLSKVALDKILKKVPTKKIAFGWR